MNGTSASAQKQQASVTNLVAILTPTIPGREELLLECRQSVRYQTYDNASSHHFIEHDDEGTGNSATVNRAAERASGLNRLTEERSSHYDWFLPLADDDLLLPGAVKSLLAASQNADIVYAPPLVNGNEDRWWFFQAPPAIPSFGLIRTGLWFELGGYDESLEHEEDRALWTKALNAGARFARVDEPCWVYRQHAANKSFNKVAA